MKEIILRKLKTISSSTNWRPGDLFFQARTTIQVFQDSVLEQTHNNHTLSSLNISEKVANVKEEPLWSSWSNADEQEKAVESPSKSSLLLPCLKPIVTEKDHTRHIEEKEEEDDDDDDEEKEVEAQDDSNAPLLPDSKDKCPPEDKDLVVLYTTSLRGIRKTFEDCNRIRFILQSFHVVFHERDVSMHLEYREELWRILGGNNRVVPPRLFIRGKYIGGADEVVGLHENGMLVKLLDSVPLSPNRGPCNGCGGMHFLLCSRCNGSRKLVVSEGDVGSMKCPDCNENGLVKCSVCS